MRLTNILSRFPRLQQLVLSLDSRSTESMEALITLAQSFRGHPTIQLLRADTSAVVNGARQCPNLQHLCIKEDIAMPISHILSMPDNGVFTIFVELGARLQSLDIDCPLLWATNKFCRWVDENGEADDGVSPTSFENPSVVDAHKVVLKPLPPLTNLTSLTIRSLHTTSLADFVVGWLSRCPLPSLTSIHLHGDETMVPMQIFQDLSRAAPSLRSMHLSSVRLDESEHLPLLFKHLGPTLESLSINCCEISLERFRVVSNVAGSVVSIFSNGLPHLAMLDVVHCKFKPLDLTVAANTSTSTISATNTTDLSDEVPLLPGFGSNLKSLVLMGFGKFIPDVSFLSRYPTLESLKMDDVGTTFAPNTSKSLWNFIAESLPKLRHLDLRFTKFTTGEGGALSSPASPTNMAPPKNSNVLPPSLEIQFDNPSQATLVNHPSFSNLTSLSLYAPPSLLQLLSILRHQPKLVDLTLRYVGADNSTDCPILDDATNVDVGLPYLRKLYLHAHGLKSSMVVKCLLLGLVRGSKNLRHLHVQATKPLLSHEENAALSTPLDSLSTPTVSPTTMSIFGQDLPSPTSSNSRTPMTPSLRDLAEIAERADARFISELMSSCPNIQLLRLNGIAVTEEALGRLVGANGDLTPWEWSLSHLELSIRGVPTPASTSDQLLRTLVRKHTFLRHLDLLIEQLPECDTQQILQAMEGMEPSISEITPPYSNQRDEYNDLVPDRGSSRVAEIQRKDAIFRQFCTLYESQLRSIGWWVEFIRVWTPSLKSQRIRSFLLRRILASGRRTGPR
ncbi:hypothetical protein HK102_000004 [Quaeritorhiza haematococci]|nr:hypothetical protein HK102_000004 [Quaeritorhiza haematococci]